MNIDNVKEAAECIERGMHLLQRGPFSFYLREMTAVYELLMTRFAPFKIGDRVMLKRAPKIPKDSGWKGAEHFLLPGAEGTVVTAECGSNGFSFGIEFDMESWLDNGVQRPRDKKHAYAFGESDITHI